MDIGLFDVVPWTHGYAHSWALRWLLEQEPRARDALLELFVPDGRSPWSVEAVKREARIGRQRADLLVTAVDAAGQARDVILETKVNDDLGEAQLATYCAASSDVVLYVPGLTGFLLFGNERDDRVRWVTGWQVADALGDLDDLPDLLRSYLHGVAAQANRMDAARKAAQGKASFDDEEDFSEVSAADVEAVAWVVEVAEAMRARGAKGVGTRNTRHDYGVFWRGSWVEMPGMNGARAYVDVIAAHGGWEYVVTIKVGEGGPDDRLAVFDAAMRTGAPWLDWRKGRRLRASSCRLWTLDASEMTAAEAAESALRVPAYLRVIAAPNG